MSKEEARQDMKMYMAADWDLKEETPEYYLLTRNNATGMAHLLVFLFTVWFTFGVGNLVYHFLCNKNKKILK